MADGVSNSGPGYKEHPEHKLIIERSNDNVMVQGDNQILAQSAAALILRESDYRPVIYFPREDVNLALFAKSDHTTYCPFKGEASYWDCGDIQNIAWSYETPFDEILDIRNHLAFYTDKVRIDEV